MAAVVKAVNQGADPFVDETVDPSFAIDYLTQAIMVKESTSGNETAITTLKEILAVYEMFRQEMSAQQAQQQAPQPQGPPMPGQELIQ